MTLETRVWMGTKGQEILTGILRVDGERLTFRGDTGAALETTISESEPRFPRSLTGIGLTLFVRGRKRFVWFDDPYARNALREATRRA